MQKWLCLHVPLNPTYSKVSKKMPLHYPAWVIYVVLSTLQGLDLPIPLASRESMADLNRGVPVWVEPAAEDSPSTARTGQNLARCHRTLAYYRHQRSLFPDRPLNH